MDNRVLGVSMNTRSSRRKLVLICYTLLGLASAGSWLGSHSLTWVTMTAVYGAIAINGLAFGGLGFFGRRGLVKPFANTPPREPGVQEELIRIRLERVERYLRMDDTSWRNDERELRRRDAVHYRAYQPLCAAMAIIVMLAQCSLHHPSWVSPSVASVAIYVIALPVTVLAVTLPQAIILWTEPDLVEPEDAGTREPQLPGIGEAFGANSKA